MWQGRGDSLGNSQISFSSTLREKLGKHKNIPLKQELVSYLVFIFKLKINVLSLRNCLLHLSRRIVLKFKKKILSKLIFEKE